MSSRAVSFVTLQENTIKYMLQFVEEYELVKAKQHKDYKYARQFFADKNICFQNFISFIIDM